MHRTRRRSFLRAGMVTGALAAGCGASATRTAAPGVPSEVEAFVADLDASLANIDASRPLAPIKHKLSPERAAGEERFIKTALRALLIAGSLRDLREEEQLHPEVQRRVWAAMLDMDTAVFEARARLEALEREDHKRLVEALSRDDRVEDGIFSELDRSARAAGVSLKRRAHLRTLAKHVCGRLRQSPELTIAEFGQRIDRVASRAEKHDSSMLRPAFFHVAAQASAATTSDPCIVPCASGPGPAAPAATAASTSASASSATSGSTSTATAISPPGMTNREVKRLVDGAILDSDGTPPRPTVPSKPEPKTSTLTVGAVMLGISGGVFGVGTLMVSGGAFAGVFLMTVGALGLIAGIIVTLVGAIASALS